MSKLESALEWMLSEQGGGYAALTMERAEGDNVDGPFFCDGCDNEGNHLPGDLRATPALAIVFPTRVGVAA